VVFKMVKITQARVIQRSFAMNSWTRWMFLTLQAVYIKILWLNLPRCTALKLNLSERTWKILHQATESLTTLTVRTQTNEELIGWIKQQLLVSSFTDITQSVLTSSITVWTEKTTLEADSLYIRKKKKKKLHTGTTK